LKEAELLRIRNGARPQQRQQALAETQEAEAVLDNTRSLWLRRQTLFQRGVLSRVDAKILETLIEMDEAPGLRAGLRVTAFILTDAGHRSRSEGARSSETKAGASGAVRGPRPPSQLSN